MTGRRTFTIPGGGLNQSQAKAFTECPHKWWLRYVDGHGTEPSDAQRLGSLCHEFFGTMALAKEHDKPPSLQSTLTQYNNRARELGITKGKAHGESMLIAYYQWLEHADLVGGTIKCYEVQLEYKGLRGTLDFIASYKGELTIIDWKTSLRGWDPADAIWLPQAWMYILLARGNGIPVVSFHYHIVTKIPTSRVVVLEVKPLKMELDRWEQVFKEMSQEMKRKTNYRRIGPHCDRCNVQDHCA